jgi:hypothetical protein
MPAMASTDSHANEARCLSPTIGRVILAVEGGCPEEIT